MRIHRLFILIAAAWAGATLYKTMRPSAPVSGGESGPSFYDSVTGPGSLMHTFRAARDAHKQHMSSTSNYTYAGSTAPSWQGQGNGFGGIGNNNVAGGTHFSQSSPAASEPEPENDLALLQDAAKNDKSGVESRLAAGVKADSRDSDRRTPLMLASWNGNQEIISELIAAGANERLQDVDRNNAFDYAAGRGQADTVQFLLRITHTDDDHYVEYATLVHAAYAGDPAQMPPGTGPLESINHLGPLGQAPLHIAAGNGSVAVIEALIARGAQVNLPSNDGQTPLHWAAWDNQAVAIRTLIAHGAKPNLADSGGDTPLMLAAENNSRNAVIALVDGGAVKNMVNQEGKTAGMIAASKGYKELAELLK